MEKINRKSDGKMQILYQGGTFSNFTITGNGFMAEREFMLAKALIFSDHQAAEHIRKAKTGKECRALGRSVRNFDGTLWDKVSIPIMMMIQYHRWTEAEDFKFLKSLAIGLGLPEFAECAPWDSKWGTGSNLEDSANGWTGRNIMGKILGRTAAIVSKAGEADELSGLNSLWPGYRMLLEKRGRSVLEDYPPSKLIKNAEADFLGKAREGMHQYIRENPAELLEDRSNGIRFRFSVFGSRNGGRKGPGIVPLPPEAEKRILSTVRAFCTLGGWVRSGGAEGVDSLAEAAARGRITIYRPQGDGTVPGSNKVDSVSSPMSHASLLALHPNPEAVIRKSSYAASLLERDFNILYGQGGLESSSLFAICWTLGGQETGGSGQTMRCARITDGIATKGIPVFNVALDGDMDELRNLFSEMKEAMTSGKDLSYKTLPSLKKKLDGRKDYFILDARMLKSAEKWIEDSANREKNTQKKNGKEMADTASKEVCR